MNTYIEFKDKYNNLVVLFFDYIIGLRAESNQLIEFEEALRKVYGNKYSSAEYKDVITKNHKHVYKLTYITVRGDEYELFETEEALKTKYYQVKQYIHIHKTKTLT